MKIKKKNGPHSSSAVAECSPPECQPGRRNINRKVQQTTQNKKVIFIVGAARLLVFFFFVYSRQVLAFGRPKPKRIR